MKELERFITQKEVESIVEREVEPLAAMTKRGFDEVLKRMDARFELMVERMDKKFGAIEKRFDLMDKRFDLLEQRMDQIGLVYVKQVDHHKFEKRVIRLEEKFA